MDPVAEKDLFALRRTKKGEGWLILPKAYRFLSVAACF